MSDVMSSDERLALSTIGGRFKVNTMRLANLIKLASSPGTKEVNNLFQAKDPKGMFNELGQDLLRSALVFLHASFEDFLRRLCRHFWLRLPPEAWGEFRKKGMDGNEKITIVELAQFRSITVEDLIQKWFDSWLALTSYNNFEDVVRVMIKLNVPEEVYKKHRIHIDFVTSRRHRIVHSVDFESPEADAPSNWSAPEWAKLLVASYSFEVLSLEIISALGIEYPNLASDLGQTRAFARTFAAIAGYGTSDQFPFV